MNTFNVFTIFPEIFDAMNYGIMGIAQEKKIISINPLNIRDFSKDKHKKTDDYPYGGGYGMVMTCQPVFDALKDYKDNYTILMSPRGELLNQDLALELSKIKNINIICGHYEGVDQRISDELVDKEISCGDYVVSGGEIPAMILIDSISRMISQVLPQEESFMEESHMDGLLEYDHYTRPEDYQGLKVPDILLSGHHKNIEDFRLAQRIFYTLKRRPDLLEKRKIDRNELSIFLRFYPDIKDDIINFVK